MTIEIFPEGSKILVFGLGLQGGGEGDVRYLLKHGFDVRLTDKKTKSELATTLSRLPQELVGTFGEHKLEDVEWADYILVNPGVSLSIKELAYAQKLGKKIVNRTALFVKNSTVPVIGVTGTRGKSTTTELIYQLLNNHFEGQILRGGNIPGISDLELLDNLDHKKYAVLELSSFQLEYFHLDKISPQYAIITNLYPDHLNRYQDLASYAYAKFAICSYQKPTDLTFVNEGSKEALAIANMAQGQIVKYQASDVKEGDYPGLPGLHNLENMAAVLKLGISLGIEEQEIYELFKVYKGLPYRLELRAIINGVKYINDTTSTTPIATIKAIEAITDPKILIFGGAEKALPTEELFKKLTESTSVKSIILLGSLNNQAIINSYETLKPKIIGQVASMNEAVSLAQSVATSGDAVLLSPGFSSFDLFKNEFDRGDQFNQVVSNMQGK